MEALGVERFRSVARHQGHSRATATPESMTTTNMSYASFLHAKNAMLEVKHEPQPQTPKDLERRGLDLERSLAVYQWLVEVGGVATIADHSCV